MATKLEFLVAKDEMLAASAIISAVIHLPVHPASPMHKFPKRRTNLDQHASIWTQKITTTITAYVFSSLKDVRANCYCASLLRTQINVPRHPLSARAKY